MEATQVATPVLGQAWPEQGGIYVGSRLVDGAAHHVIMQGGTESDLIDIEFDQLEAVVSERGEVNGHSDWRAPTQEELVLGYINARDQFDKSDWYWSSTPYGSFDAWAVDFEDGYVLTWDRFREFRVRPVRSIIA